MRIGLATGCFDGLHPGHEFFLKRAKEHCDWLIVAVNSDRSVQCLKGPGRPIRSLAVRLHAISRLVDSAIPFDGNAEQLAISLWPDVIIRGEDQLEESAGFDVVRIPRLRGFSTTECSRGPL